MEYFAGLTAPQADVIVALLGLLSVLVGVTLAPVMFLLITRKGVTNFEAAITKVTSSAKNVEGSVANVTTSVDLVSARAAEIVGDLDTLKATTLQINDLVSALQRSNAMVQARQDEEDEQTNLETQTSTTASDDEQQNKEAMRALWADLQGLIEDSASDPDIDGRTRAKYARMDRRKYEDLAVTLFEDGRLPGTESQWRSAIDIWNKSKRNGHRVAVSTVEQFRREVDKLKAAQDEFNKANEHLADKIRMDACNGVISAPLTFDLLKSRYAGYEISYLRSLLPNYAEGGYWHKKGEPPRFRRIAIGKYEPICDEQKS